MATSSPRLVFGAASGITAEDLMFSTHLGSANMALHSFALSIPCLGHSGWHPSGWRQNLSPSARLSGGSCHYGKRFCCHMQGPINRCKQSALPLLAEAQLPLSNSLQLFVHFFLSFVMRSHTQISAVVHGRLEPRSFSSPLLFCLESELSLPLMLINIQYAEDRCVLAHVSMSNETNRK